MKKKVIGSMVLLAMVFTFVACNGDLAQYKTDAKAEITNHVATLNADEYTAENWTLIGQCADEGKAEVDNVETKAAVDTAKSATITDINGISPKEEVVMQIQAKRTYLDKCVKQNINYDDYKSQYGDATTDDVSFIPFLGIYDDTLVAVFYGGKYHGPQIEVEESVEIADLTFVWSHGYPILVWNDGEIYGLAEAFGQNLLTAANLVTIHELYYSEV